MAAPVVRLAWAAFGIVVGVHTPTLQWYIGVGHHPVEQQLPERILVGCVRESAIDSDHGDGHHDNAPPATRCCAMASIVGKSHTIVVSATIPISSSRSAHKARLAAE